ncbi:macro domain-containing protein [Argonema galeatum]|uniref:macro domain-containing protein n=1 Tax=Argonema galeatum TaxID=2942762 RepID=UPI0020121C96|nr:macro domain-containing protein [Argonema galeatum]MCL1467873.1 macro domain-containing protein [Argonema galeatum A003/A1]
MKTPQIELIPLRAAVSSDSPTTLDVLVRIIPPNPEEDIKRSTLNIGLVIDRSGSMAGQKIEYARQAACYAVQQLLPSDRVSVTIYDDRVETLAPTTLAINKADIIRKIQEIRDRNSTALHAGWVQGGIQVSQHLNREHLNRVILLSDGQANVGETNPDVIASDVHGLAERGVSTTTMGVGDDYNEDLLEAMARSGDGNYYYIRSPEQLPTIFERELQGLMATIGSTVTLGIEPRANVEFVEVLNNLDINDNGRFQLPNLVIGNPIEVLVRLKVPAMAKAQDLCYFRLAWNNPQQQERQKIRMGLQLPVVSSAQLEEFPLNLEVQQQVALQMAARAKKEAVRLVDRGEYDQASLLLQQTQQKILSNPHLPMMAPEAEALSDLDSQLQSREMSTYRKMSSYQSQNRQYSSGHYALYYRLKLSGGDIAQKRVDAIVNSASSDLSSNGAISSAIHSAAGPELLEECSRLNGCGIGEAKITRGYNLPAQWVIHTVCPVWEGGSSGEELLLAQCYRSCLELAVQNSINAIAFPAMGIGAMGFPIQLAAQIAFKEVSRFLASNTSIGTVIFVCLDRNAQTFFDEELRKVIGR